MLPYQNVQVPVTHGTVARPRSASFVYPTQSSYPSQYTYPPAANASMPSAYSPAPSQTIIIQRHRHRHRHRSSSR
jgi:hypothetical protein